MILEWSIESIEEMEYASQLGIKRVELCSSLEYGGLTPAYGVIKKCAQIKEVELHVMIRPRPGDFEYSEKEIEIMCSDIQNAADLGAKGVVFGVLDQQFNIQKEQLKRLTELSSSLGLEITFHRAFDFISSPFEALEELIEAGVHRLLTSGQQSKAIDGLPLIKKLIAKANGRIEIMAGAGINAINAQHFQGIGLSAIHCTARRKVAQMDNFYMGSVYAPYVEKIKSILAILN